MDIEIMGEALRLVATTLSPPVIWLLVLLLFAEAKLHKRKGWDLLALAWLANILYLYNDTFAATTTLFGLQISQFLGANLSLATSVFFLAFARETARGRKRALYDAALAGASVVVISAIIAHLRLGGWQSIFASTSHRAPDLAFLYTPLILFSAVSTSAAAIGLREQLRTARGSARRLISGAWLAYAVLQFAYYTKFSPNKIFILSAFVVAWIAKLCIAAGLFLLFKQDTETVQAQRVIQQSQAQQQLAFSWFAHELKNPIHSLKFRAATINTRLALKDYARARADATKLLQTANVLTSIIESVKLAAEPIDQRKLEFFSINDAISEALDQVKSAMQVETHVIRTDFGKNVTVCATRSALVQIFVNLLRNGLEACAGLSDEDLRRTRHLKMYVETKRMEGVVRVRVVDFGMGIPRETLASMFEPYYSTKDGINRGLGLWVVKTFVETFHGNLRVTSPIERVGRGSAFELCFPSAHGKDVAATVFFNSTQPLLEPA